MSIGMLRGEASGALKGKRLITTVGYVLSLVSWTLVAQIYITLFGFDAVFSILIPLFEGWTGFQLSYLLLPILLILLFLLGDMLHMSYRWFGMDLLNGKELEVKTVFQGFKKENAKKLFSLVVLRGVIVFGWSLLFVLPGIWKAYMYSQAANYLKADPSLSSMEALKESEKLMKGKGFSYALLQLTFAPWYAVPIILFGIFVFLNRWEIGVGIDMGAEAFELVFGMLFAMVLMIGLLLIIFSLFVEPKKMVTKQVFFRELTNPQKDEQYDDFEKELLKKQGLNPDAKNRNGRR